MAGDGVDLHVNLKLDSGDLSALSRKINDDLSGGIARGAGKAAEGLSKVEDKVEDIKEAAQRAAKASEGLLNLEKIKTGVGAMGDLKDIFEKSGAALFGFSKQTTDAIVMTGDLAEKGAAVGESFGPMGALIGGVTGALMGYITSTKQAAEAARQLAAAEKVKRQELALSVGGAAGALQSFALDVGVDVFGLSGKSIEALEAREEKLQGILKQEGEFALDAAKKYDALSKSQTASAKDLAAAKSANEMYAKSLSEKSLELGEVRKSIDAYNKSLEGTADITEVVAEETGKGTDKDKADLAEKKKKEDAAKAAADAAKRRSDARVKAIEEETRALLDREKVETTLDIDGLAGMRDDLPETEAKLKGVFAEIERVNLAMDAMGREAIETSRAIDFLGGSLDENKDLVVDFALAVTDYMGGKAIGALNNFYDSWANKEKLTQDDRKRRRAEFLRDTGDFLVMDGFKHVLAGGADLASGKLSGGAEVSMGLIEMGAGAAMGGVGAVAQRRLGGTEDNPGARGGSADGSPRVSALDEAAGPTQHGTITIYMGGGPGSTVINAGDTERGRQEAKTLLERILGRSR